jgi:threonylcarbamoyladenosine tRNA methylthiotransferase CDKAL1
MAGQLEEYGYNLIEEGQKDAADLWLINTCTVKNPSQSAMSSLIAAGRRAGKALVIAGCVPQGDRRLPELDGLSIIGRVSAHAANCSLTAVRTA